MSELETRKSSAAAERTAPQFAAPRFASPEAQTAEIAAIVEYDGGELEPDGATEVLAAVDADADADLLAIPPRADDLGTALAARPPRLKLPRVTTTLVAAALICAGFIGGVLVQKHLGSGSTGGRGANFAFTGTGTRGGAGAAGGFGGFGGRGGAGGTGATGAGNAITGTVTVVSGDKLYVTASDGSVYTVTTTGTTTVNVTKAGSLSQLKAGQSVVIAGSNDGSGNVTATSITANSAASSSGN